MTSAVFTGGTGTVSVGGTLYAKQGGALTLTVVTSNDTKCVEVAGAATLPTQTSDTPKTGWIFTATAPAGNGAQAFTVGASDKSNNNGCNGTTNTTQASYTLDNTGPVVTPAVTPTPNAAGWNKTNTTVAWTATDSGSGVISGPTPASSTESTNGIVIRTSTATDRLGNVGNGSVTVQVDKSAPGITATEVKNSGGTSTFTFSCTDPGGSGIKSCPPVVTLNPGASGTYTATDTADNTSSPITVTNTFVSDIISPTISHSVAPVPNAAGWNNANAMVTFTCADNTGGSGIATCVADGTAAATKTISTETNGTVVAGTATDVAGNKATDSTTIKLDKTVPTVSASRAPGANGNGWNNTDVTVTFACSDGTTPQSGIKSCPAPVVLSAGASQSANGTATDNADNISTAASVTGVNVDKTAPSLSGAPTTTANSNGWYNGDVTIQWTATDSLSGLAGAAPANSTIGGEGSGLKATTSVSDKAGNTTTADSAAVNIDRHAPTTGISGTSNNWTNGNVTVSLSATDNLSTVAKTEYSIDGGAAQTGTTFTLSTEGDHTVTFFSTDKAGNAESVQTAHVKIDKTAPTISHAFTPLTYTNGAWTNQNVTVTFTCADQGGSGVAGCTAPVTKSAEGSYTVDGTATDGAGNSATDSASVRIDKTAPTITATAGGIKNAAGWYKADVTVTYSASDAASGITGTLANDVLGEGANQSTSATVTDAAGNSSTAGVAGINVDRTNPVLDGTFTSGWHTGDVTVAWFCTDALSGPAAQPAATTVSGEGDNLSAAATCTDVAGNATTTTVTGIHIDRTAPATGVAISGPLFNGWYTAGTTVKLTSSDNLSGVAATYYSVDGGAAHLYSDAFSIATDGTYTVTYWSTDSAGNIENTSGNSVTLNVDQTAPTLSGAPTTSPNSNGWYSGDVTVHWTCSDPTSGIDGTCPLDSTVTGEGSNLGAAESVSDKAGNHTSTTVAGLKIDRTAPTTTSSVAQPLPSGWYGAAVQVTLNGNDNLSNVAATNYTVDGGVTQTYNGAFSFGTEGTHTIGFWSTDGAGNVETAGATLTLKIDTTAPTTTVINPMSPESGWFVKSGIPVAFDAHDADSGIAATYYTIDGGSTQTYGEPFTAELSTGSHTITYWSVDLANNEEAHATTNTIAVSVDTDAPTISGAASPTPNSFGWNNTAVVVTFTCADIGSGLQTGIAGCADPVTLTANGAGQAVHGNAVDRAGNTSGTDVGGINIDRTAPTLTGEPTTSANGAGWYAGDVVVHWTATDPDSGIAIAPADTTITAEGTALTSTTTVINRADLSTTATSSPAVNIDRTAPSTAIAGSSNDWTNGSVTVSLSASDNLSTVAKTEYTIDGGAAQTGTTFTLSTEGDHTVTFHSTDKAGNAESVQTAHVKIDKTAPTISHAFTPLTYTNGAWTNTDVTVTFTCADQGGSGVASCTAPVTKSAEGSYTVDGNATDGAGNSATDTASVRIDKTAPTITATAFGIKNAAGWYKADVTVTYTANDHASGIAGTPADDVLAQGANQSASATVTDAAGNSSSAGVTGINIDKTAPALTGTYSGGWHTGDVTVTWTCTDALSGPAAQPAATTVSGEGDNLSAAATCTDVAGNATTTTVTGIHIDRTAPTTTNATAVPGSGWYTGAVQVTLHATDNLSGIATTNYTVDGGPTQTYTTAFTYNTEGIHTIAFWSTDEAGNTELAGTPLILNIDKTKPTIDGTRTPLANGFGWNNTSVDVTFTCADSGSGLAGCSPITPLTNDGAGQFVPGGAVDIAGNTNSTNVDGINIDKTKPTLSGTPTTHANAEGWYKGDVSIGWTGVDTLSGTNPATQPANSTITGEGSSLVGGPVTIADKAGNVSDSTSVTGVKIDRTAPVITGVLPTGHNAAGWYQGDVVVGFTCADPALADGTAGSGVAACPSDVMLKGDGANQSVTSVTAIDVAGNASAGKTVTGINIDGHEPKTTADNQCTVTNGYCKGATATVVLSSTDVGPSGVKEIHYTVNGGAEQVAAGASKTLSIPTDGTGHATFTYYGVDNAGNVELTKDGALKYDNVAPTVTHTVTPAANAADWNNSNVTIHFDANDTDPGSGVDTTSVTPNSTVSSETTSSGMVVNGSAKDTAGNVGTDSVTVRLDKTAPSITGAIVPGTTMVGGWYTGSVKVHFTCSDALSGVGVCPADVTVTSNGANQSVTRSATDIAGNIASATVSGITIDSEKPTITSVNVANGSYTLGVVPAATCTATDSFSGVATCKVTVTGGNVNGVGTFSYSAVATDKAGNTSAALTGAYAVTYRFEGFLQPINDTAHQVGTSTSIFKAGSTVPVKFQLKNAAGQVVSATTAPLWLTPVKGSSMSAPVDESVYTTSPDSGSTYRYDAAAQQYIYNWKTGTGGNYWRIGVTFDDGQTYYVNIGLR